MTEECISPNHQIKKYEELGLEELNLPALIKEFNDIYREFTETANQSQQRINKFTKTDPYSIELRSYEEPKRNISQSAKKAYLDQIETEIDTILSLLDDENSSPETIDTAINRLQTIDSSIPLPFKPLSSSVESTISTTLTITVTALSICTIHYLSNPNFDLDTFKVLLMTSVLSICLVYNKDLLSRLSRILEIVKNLPIKDRTSIQISRHSYSTQASSGNPTTNVQKFTDTKRQYDTNQQRIADDFNSRLFQTLIDTDPPATPAEQAQLEHLKQEVKTATATAYS